MTAFPRAFSAAVFATLLSFPVLARAESLRCSDITPSPAGALCGAFESAVRADPTHVNVVRALSVWRRVRAPVAALTGRETAVAFLAESVVIQGKPPSPAAYLCPGAPPTVYVPASLLDKVYGKDAYSEDFLAFVFGHELGHRVNDVTVDGCQLAAFQRPGQGKREEALADARGAFFAAVAGFSTRSIAKAGLVDRFLELEFKVREDSRKDRKDALTRALERFDGFEHLYEVALAFAFGASRDTAIRLLAHADELVEAEGVPLPELKVVRALVLIMSVGAAAPAFGGLDARIAALRCEPVFPAHTALWERPRRTLRKPAAGVSEVLRAARRLLGEALALGASDVVVHSGLGCVAAYLGEHTEAKRETAIARRFLGPRQPQSVAHALDGNDALVDLLAALREKPLPGPADTAGRSAWIADMKARNTALSSRPEIQSVLVALATPSGRVKETTLGPTCAVRSPPVPWRSLSLSGPACPPDFALLHTLPDAEAVARTGATPLLRTCARAGARVTQVRLPATNDPPFAAESTSLVEVRGLPPAAQPLSAWTCGCELVERGASDQGGRTYTARCGDALPAALLFVSAEGQVERVISFEPLP